LDWHETLEGLVALVGREVVVVGYRPIPLEETYDPGAAAIGVFTLGGTLTGTRALPTEDEDEVEVRFMVGEGSFTLHRDLWASTSRDDDGTLIIHSLDIVIGVGLTRPTEGV
jgi:hypothetical protein